MDFVEREIMMWAVNTYGHGTIEGFKAAYPDYADIADEIIKRLKKRHAILVPPDGTICLTVSGAKLLGLPQPDVKL